MSKPKFNPTITGYKAGYQYGDNRFTMSLRNLYEEGFNLFDVGDNYPLDEEYKEAFESLFLAQYWLREIGQPVWHTFKHLLYVDLKKISMVYNRKIAVFEQAFASDPNVSQRMSTSTVAQALSSTAQNSAFSNEQTSKSVNKFNDTPKGKLTAITDGYLTSLGEIENEGTTENETTTNNESEQNNNSNTIYEGFTQQEIDLISNYASKLRNIISEMVDELDSNFFQIYYDVDL